MSDLCCADCGYYLRHYTFDTRKIFRVHCGHCTLVRARRKPPDAKVCEHFIPGVPPEDAFTSREYLSRQLLDYVLNLELLPEIEDRG